MSLQDVVNEAFAGPAWHGPSLTSAIRGVGEDQAAWRPAADRHSIWEVLVHTAYWKHIVRQRLTGRRERFPFAGRNWFARPDGDRRWADDVALAREEHEALVRVVSTLDARALRRRVHQAQTAEANILGIAMHDVYHAGQIQLLKALQRR